MTETQPIIDALTKLAEHKVIEEGKARLLVLPEGKHVQDLKPYLDAVLPAPERIVGTAQLTTVDGLIEYLKRFKTPDTAVFASDEVSLPQLVGIIDFHGHGANAEPRFGDHRARYGFPISDQMKAWSGISGKPLSHEDFASFIQDREHDITNPPVDWMQVKPDTIELLLHLLNLSDDQGANDEAVLDNNLPGRGMTARDRRRPYESPTERDARVAKDDEPDDEPDERYIPRTALYKLRAIRFGTAQRLIQLARTVELSINTKATEGYNPKTGERVVIFKDEHEARDGAGRRVTVPDAFLLQIPVFEGETSQTVPVSLRYARKGGSISWFLTLHEWRRVIRYAVKTEAQRVLVEAGVPVFFGQPAAPSWREALVSIPTQGAQMRGSGGGRSAL